jgi:hypothetical protein
MLVVSQVEHPMIEGSNPGTFTEQMTGQGKVLI